MANSVYEDGSRYTNGHTGMSDSAGAGHHAPNGRAGSRRSSNNNRTDGGANNSNRGTAVPSSRSSTTRGKLNVVDLVDSDTDGNNRPLKRKVSPPPEAPTSHSNEYKISPPSSSVYPNDHVPAKYNRASASPAIMSILNDPPSPPLRPRQTSPGPNQPPLSTPPTSSNNNAAIVPASWSPPQPKAVVDIVKKETAGTGTTSASGSSKRSSSTAPASGAPSPKPARAVPAAPTKNSGLLAGAFGDVALGDDDPEPTVPTVVLQIALNGETNKYINVSKLAEEKYGWAVLNPGLARAKQRMGQEASGDEAMMDASESESAVEDKMLSDAGQQSGTGATKKRKRRQDEYYDANDPFIDDSEMLWEEQAAASKDGFFVYSGPLVPEGEKPQIERVNGPSKRGRGRGGRASGTGRGAGNAGKPTAPRKPRVTKAVKEKMEREKEERERAGKMAAALPPPRSIPA